MKSKRWPGSVTVAKGGNFCTIYVGDGVKSSDFETCYYPTEPPEVMDDPPQQDDHAEPFGEDPVEPAKLEGEEGGEEGGE